MTESAKRERDLILSVVSKKLNPAFAEGLRAELEITPRLELPKATDCLEIVKAYLEDNGFDGLCGDGCGCGLGTGLAPCSMDMGIPLHCCKPAYLVKRSCLGCETPCDAYSENGEQDCFSPDKPGVKVSYE